MKLVAVTAAVLISLLGAQVISAQGYYGGVGNVGYSIGYGNWNKGGYLGGLGGNWGMKGGFSGAGFSSYGTGYSGYGKSLSGYGSLKKGYSGYGKKGGFIDETIILPGGPIPLPAGYGAGVAGVGAGVGSGLGSGIFAANGPLGLFVLVFLGLVLLNNN